MNKRLYYRSQKKNKPNKPEEGIYEGQTKIDKLKKKSGGVVDKKGYQLQ